jgi:CDP-diacylglycerol---glycerol-3-phosphate 3-phosphatidyltransferase
MAAANIPKHVQEKAVRWLGPVFAPFIRARVDPNLITTVGFLVTITAAIWFFLGHVRIGGLFILLGGFVDIIDGQVARATGKTSVFGSFYDSTLDRVSEIAVFIGIFSLYSGGHPDFHHPWMVYTVALAMAGSLMVSYTRSRAETLGLDCNVGWMQRLERVVLLGVSALFFGGSFRGLVLTGVLIVMAVLTNFTAFQRIAWVYKHTRVPASPPQPERVTVPRRRVTVTSESRTDP